MKKALAELQRSLAQLPLAVVIGFVVALAGLLTLFVWSRLTLRRQIEAQNWVTQTYRVNGALNDVYISVQEAESAQRAFTISGLEETLKPFDHAITVLPQRMAALRRLIRDRGVQRQRLAELDAAVDARIEYALMRVEQRRELGAGALDPSLRFGQGPQLMERVRNIVDTMRADEDRLLDSRLALLERRRRWSLYTQLALGLAGLGILGAVFVSLVNQVSRTQRAEAEARAASGQQEIANKELQAFAYSVAHDLRAPLRAINGFTGVILEDHAAELSTEAQAALDRVVLNGARMSQLIDDLLTLSRVSATAIEPRKIDMVALVQSVCDELVPAAQSDGRKVELHVDRALPPAAGDPSLIRQVWINLVGNALKFTRGRTPARIEIGGTVAGADFSTYFIRDNGAGFNMSYVGKLFGAFQRLHRPDEFEGNGVGLALVQRIVQRHGGAVWAEATEGTGAQFAFTLPEWGEK